MAEDNGVSQGSPKTSHLIAGTGVAAAIATILSWAATTFIHVDMPVSVSGAFGALLTAVASHWYGATE